MDLFASADCYQHNQFSRNQKTLQEQHDSCVV